MGKTIKSVMAALVLAASCCTAQALDVTINLLDAREGGWTRRARPNNYVETEYVAMVEGEGESLVVTLQLLRHHDGHVLSNKVVEVPGSYIGEKGIGAGNAPAKMETVEYKGVRYATTVVESPMRGAVGKFYLSDQIPGNGIVKIDIVYGAGNIVTIWNDSYGSRPDDLIMRAGPGANANAEFGIPMPRQ